MTGGMCFAPALREGLASVGQIPLKETIARALQMGDGLHSRVVAASGAVLRRSWSGR
jgi:hypothetical protein